MFDVKVISNKNQDDKLSEVLALMKKLENTEVLVGIPAEENARGNGGTINNAELLYIHTHGSAIKNIPPRPVLEPAIEDDRAVIGGLLGEAATAAVNGDENGMMNALEKAGMQGQNSARAWFDSPKNNWTPLKKRTIDAKGSDKPLIDLGELLKSITYIVEEK